MPIGGSNRVGLNATGIKLDPKFISELVQYRFFPDLCNIQSRGETRDDMGGIKYIWTPVPELQNMPCLKYDRVPREERTAEIVDELKLWTVALAGYFPTIEPAWRIVFVGPRATGQDKYDIFDVIGVDTDSLHTYTVLTAKLTFPYAELGV